MKKLLITAVMAWVLSGCAGEETLETIADDWIQPVMAAPGQIFVVLPQETAAPVLGGEMEQIYFGENYEIVVETLNSGDLEETIRHISGYGKEDLTVMTLQQENAARYEFVWACAGENGDWLGRAAILDDGQYHYCLSVLRPVQAETASKVCWDDVFRSFSLVGA